MALRNLEMGHNGYHGVLLLYNFYSYILLCHVHSVLIWVCKYAHIVLQGDPQRDVHNCFVQFW